MKLLLPTLGGVLRLQLLLICGCHLAHQLAPPPPLLRRNIIKVRASGFLPFESDLVLPLGILRQLQAQERASHVLPRQQLLKRRRPKPKPKSKQKVRLERTRLLGPEADAGIQMYNLIDDDGELLLNLRVHSEANKNSNSNSNKNSNSNSLAPDHTLDATPWLADKGAPWRPSKWRPTTATPTITSSSPRPLPLHQYLSSSISSNSISSNSVEQTLTQRRRMFGPRRDWIYK